MYPDKLISQEEFFLKYLISKKDFEKSTLIWTDLEEIYLDYIPRIPHLDRIGALIFNGLMKSSGVHSVRYRIKDAEHLIEKIIRKKIDSPDRIITLNKYRDEITDLIGVRALHLFKEDWKPIHDFITENWDLKESAVAYIRTGDNEPQIEAYKQSQIETKMHKKGYRSVHYTIETKPGKVKYYGEIQVRTIFEEAWSEIDHTITYPYDQDNILFVSYLGIMNRLAGTADEMGSFISMLKKKIELDDSKNQKEHDEKDKKLEEYQKILKSDNPKPADLNKVSKGLEQLQLTSWLGSSLNEYKKMYGLIESSELNRLIGSQNALSDSVAKMMREMDINKIGAKGTFKLNPPQE